MKHLWKNWNNISKEKTEPSVNRESDVLTEHMTCLNILKPIFLFHRGKSDLNIILILNTQTASWLCVLFVKM